MSEQPMTAEERYEAAETVLYGSGTAWGVLRREAAIAAMEAHAAAAVEAVRFEHDLDLMRYTLDANGAKRVAEREFARADAAESALAAERAKVERLREALTPSSATKAAYIGEVFEEKSDTPISWTATKTIMRMILNRAALAETGPGETQETKQ